MPDYIDRKTALSFPFANEQYDRENANEDFIFGCESYKEWLENLPVADVQEVKHGKWIKKRYQIYECSRCKRSVYLEGLNVTDENEIKLLKELYPYCHCGAKMDRKEK